MRGHVLFVTDRQLVPGWSGNRMRIVGFLRALRTLGHEVTLIGANLGPMKEIGAFADHVVEVAARSFSGGEVVDFDVRPFRNAVAQVAASMRPVVAIAQYAWLAPALDALAPDVERWVDCHDVLHERTTRFLEAGLDPWTICTWQQEAQLLARVDVLITCQHRDAEVLGALLPDKRVECIMTLANLPDDFVRASASGHTVLTIGALHAGNAGLLEFARDAWPRVLARVPDARLEIVGGIGEGLPAMLGVDSVGQVPDLHPRYAAAAVVVSPVMVGSGVKTKMLEALRYGKAVVVTTHCEEGLVLPGRPAWVARDTLDGCADAISDLLLDDVRRRELETEAFAFGARHLSSEVFRDQIGSLLSIAGKPGPISIVVSHEGSHHELHTCLRAVFQQSAERLVAEVIVVEHGTGNHRASTRREFGSVTVTRVEGTGAAGARRHGALLAMGDVLAFIDSGCRPAADWLERALATARREGEPCVVASNIKAGIPPSGAPGVRWHEALELQNRIESERETLAGAARAMLLPRQVWQSTSSLGIAEAGAEGPPRGIVYASDAVVVHRVRSTWHELRAQTRLRAQSDVHAQGVKLVRELGPLLRVFGGRLKRNLNTSLRSGQVPRRYRLDVVAASVLVWYWSVVEARKVVRNRHAYAAHTPDALIDVWQGAPVPPLRSISIIVPCAGWADTLPACIGSLRRQNVGVPVEIIVVVNGRDDRPPSSEWPGITILHEAKNGPAAARNTGVRASTGDVLAFIDADCVAAPQWLTFALSTMCDNAAPCIVAGGITRSGAHRNWISLYDSRNYLQQESYVRGSANFVTANLVVHRSLFQRIEPFDEMFEEAAFEDWDWARRARDAGVRILYDGRAMVDHPCMSRPAELKRKAERLSRGALLMQGKLGAARARPGLLPAVYGQARRAIRARGVGLVDRMRLLCAGVAVAYWTWSEGRRAVAAERSERMS